MNLAPLNYNFGNASNYSFATTITCNNEDARKMFVEGFGHMLNYNHEQAIACWCIQGPSQSHHSAVFQGGSSEPTCFCELCSVFLSLGEYRS